MQDLVNRGLIPRQSLEPAPQSRDAVLQDLVNRGLIPRQSLEPAPQSRDAVLQDLVNRGLIPRQALDDTLSCTRTLQLSCSSEGAQGS